MNAKSIYHIASKEDWAKAEINGYYETESLLTEGFIHCSTREELVNTANRRFNMQSNLTLLELDVAKIAHPVVYENLLGGKVMYPHIYGKLNCDAIIQAYNLNQKQNAAFEFPELSDCIDLFQIERHFLKIIIKQFSEQKLQGERAMEQLNEGELFYKPNSESNSIAIIVQHLSGNMISRWTDFLTTDGEKENRNRDQEFVVHLKTHEEVMIAWENGWKVLLNTLSSLKDTDLLKIVYIRGEAHSILKAITRQIAHYAFHAGQIVYLAKQIKGEQWKTLSIARGKSKEFKP